MTTKNNFESLMEYCKHNQEAKDRLNQLKAEHEKEKKSLVKAYNDSCQLVIAMENERAELRQKIEKLFRRFQKEAYEDEEEGNPVIVSYDGDFTASNTYWNFKKEVLALFDEVKK